MGLSLQGESQSGMGVYSVDDKLIADPRLAWTCENGIEQDDVRNDQTNV